MTRLRHKLRHKMFHRNEGFAQGRLGADNTVASRLLQFRSLELALATPRERLPTANRLQQAGPRHLTRQANGISGKSLGAR
jgi:hypothetical protein